MITIPIKGDIITNDLAPIYDFYGMEYTSPNTVSHVLNSVQDDENIQVVINSPGGMVTAGTEIYSELLSHDKTVILITGLAASAAGLIAMSGYSQMTPSAMLMLHNSSVDGASGDYHEMEKMGRALEQTNKAIAAAFSHKSGMSEEDVLELMDKESWLTAKDCLEFGFIDEIVPEPSQSVVTNHIGGIWLTPEKKDKALAELSRQKERQAKANDILKDLDSFGMVD